MAINQDEKIEVKEIVLKVDGKEVKLSLDSARSLRELLNALLGDENPNKIVYLPPIWYTNPYPLYPPVYPNWTITYGYKSNGSSTTYLDSSGTLFLSSTS